MDNPQGSFSLKVMDPDRVIYEGEVTNLFLQGDTGEFEILPFHYPVLSVLRQGRMIINWKYYIAVRKGIVRFFKNECVAIVELDEEG